MTPLNSLVYFDTPKLGFFFLCQISYPKQGKLCYFFQIFHTLLTRITFLLHQNVGIRFVFSFQYRTNIYDLPLLSLNIQHVKFATLFSDFLMLFFKYSKRDTCVSTCLTMKKVPLVTRFAVVQGVQVTMEVTPG